MIAVVDYGAGNLFSVKNALTYIGVAHEITADPARIAAADGVLLPGVGAFPDAMRRLRDAGLVDPLREAAVRRPFLGICLGMQLLFERGYEFAPCEGLGLLPGAVERLPENGLKIPHMGWNALDVRRPACPLLRGVPDGSYVYFVHSYAAVCPADVVAASTPYGGDVTALVWRGNVFGAQFHPEKSAAHGLQMLRNFAALCGEGQA